MNQEMLQKEVPRIAEELGLSEEDVSEAFLVGRLLSFATTEAKRVGELLPINIWATDVREAWSPIISEIYIAIARAIGIRGRALAIVEKHYRDGDVLSKEWEHASFASVLYHFMSGLVCSLYQLDGEANAKGDQSLMRYPGRAMQFANYLEWLIADDDEEA
jgi:hypothetical protein